MSFWAAFYRVEVFAYRQDKPADVLKQNSIEQAFYWNYYSEIVFSIPE